jgi:YVTN family beta-propeller protein
MRTNPKQGRMAAAALCPPRNLIVAVAVAVSAAAAVTAAAAADLAPLAYVSNQQGAVSVIDLGTMEVKATLELGARGPRGLGLNDDGHWLVTANLNDQNISVVDTASGALVKQVPIGKNPEFVRVMGNLAYVTFEPGAAASGPPAAAPAGAKDEDDDKVPGHVAVVDLQQGKVVLDIVGKPETEGVEFSRDGKLMILANESDNSLSLHDRATGKLLRTVSLAKYGNRPRGIKAAPDGGYVTTLELSNKLLVLNDQFEVVREVATGKAPYGVAFDPTGKRVVVAANKEKALQVFDAGTWAKIKDIPSGERCWHFSFTPDGRNILLACGKSNEVLVIDAARLEVTKRIGNLKGPWGVVTFPRAAGSID